MRPRSIKQVIFLLYFIHVIYAENLIDEPKCPEIGKWCRDVGRDDLTVLECLQSLNPKDLGSLKRECQTVIWQHTNQIIEDGNVRTFLEKSCRDDVGSFSCPMTTERVNYFSCVLERREEIKSDSCLKDIQRLESVAFFDLRWVSQFLQICSSDLERLHCNVKEVSAQVVFNGQMLMCLQGGLESLNSKCRKQVLKLTEIQADNIKLDPELYYACAADRLRFCRDYHPGTGLVFKCLMQHRSDKMTGNCREQLYKRQTLIAQDFKISKGLMRACREDIRKSHCRKQISDDKTIRLAQILLCLENYIHNGTKVSSTCEGEMIDQRKMLMEDYRLSPEIVNDCKNDIARFCKSTVTGRTLHCLMAHTRVSENGLRISDICQRALETLIKETDAGEDWRVDPVLQEACQSVVTQACQGIQGGDARVMSCLMDNIGTNAMTDECENALVQIQYFVARDFNLDPLLYRSCKDDAVTKCHATNSWVEEPNRPENAPLILPCLYRYAYHENPDLRLKPICFEQVKRVMRQRALSVDLQPEVEDKCIEDLSQFCFNKVKKGEEIQCLQDHLSELKETCRKAVTNFTEEQAQHIELNPVILMHCKVYIDRHCRERRDEGDVMDCLILHKNNPDVKSDNKCHAAIEHFQLISLKNYHFTYRFKLACKPYVMRYCQGARTKSDVISCLSEIVRNDTLLGFRHRILKDCRQQIRSQLFQQRENIKFDVKLRDACTKDIEKFCPDVKPGSAQVLECLKTTATNKRLSDRCQKQMFKINIQDMIDNSVDYTLITMCSDMIKHFCEETEPAQVLDCLIRHKDEPSFDNKCQHVVVHRMIEQSKDYRFNPRLHKACSDEIWKFCSNIIQEQRPDQEMEGKVTECLKKQFRKSNLRPQCEAEMSEILREQALNYQLNPLLKRMCKNELETICKVESDPDNFSGKTEECLKNAFLNKKPMTKECQTEVASLIEDSEADIHVDPLLQKACMKDLLTYCSDVQQGGGKQLKCLEVAMTEQKPMESECSSMLKTRIEMFRNAAIVSI